MDADGRSVSEGSTPVHPGFTSQLLTHDLDVVDRTFSLQVRRVVSCLSNNKEENLRLHPGWWVVVSLLLIVSSAFIIIIIKRLNSSALTVFRIHICVERLKVL